MTRTAFTCLAALSPLLCNGASAAEKYQPQFLQPPVYDRAMKLADGLAIAELVVSGSASGERSARRMTVEKVMFGTVNEKFRGDDGSLKLARISRVLPGKPGVWLLVRTRSGYLSINPEVSPLTENEFRRLQRPREHWTDRRDLVEHTPGEHQLYRTYVDPKTNGDVWHGPNSYGIAGREVTVELQIHGQRQFWIRWDHRGQIDRVARIPARGHGLFLDYHDQRIVWFQHFLDRKLHGLERRYHTDREAPPRFEKLYTLGVIDGGFREWNDAGKLVRDVKYESGLIPPIVRYVGQGTSGVRLIRTSDGAMYTAAPAVAQVKIGMTTDQVSQLLKVDFSPTSGIHFPTYHLDQYLHVAFKNGVVSAITRGHNGICLEPVAD